MSQYIARLHDAYAQDYDSQVEASACYITDLLFGLAYEYTQASQVMLDVGIGSGLSSFPFLKAGLQVHGMDFSFAMLEISHIKHMAHTLTQADIQDNTWPYPSGKFDLVVCCGVMHFLDNLAPLFTEARRVLKHQGLFAFTTKYDPVLEGQTKKNHRVTVGDFEIFSHSNFHIKQLMKKNSFTNLKTQRCLVDEDVFQIFIVHRDTD